ncbi:MAG: methyltransferase type 12 [Sphingobacteriales bacterium BACL12 MAG-120802-bin5]|jgi:ubiquinone/menaquinone biosynthesis C-methylase UbiE|nr:MAG: methyltransferase type 12 [Sphingobacteriales bacterium BACL12 MAG-120802-bin5]
MSDYLIKNRELWNNRAPVHFNSSFYDVEGFLRNTDSLKALEKELIGDVTDKQILHLQCHFGQDSISLEKRGAIVTGVDFSTTAIELAKKLNDMAGTHVRFIESDVYSLHQQLDEKFDMVYTTFGVLGWLPDLTRWAQTVARFLKPGGRLVLAEFHPVVWMFDDQFRELIYDYSSQEPIIEQTEQTYAADAKLTTGTSYSWNHGIGDVVEALTAAGLFLRSLKEYDYSPHNCFANTIEFESGKFRIQHLKAKIPMCYSILAQSP